VSKVAEFLGYRKTVVAKVRYQGRIWVRVRVVRPRANTRNPRFWIPRCAYFPKGGFARPEEVIVIG
jgi:hypothetical protein